MGGHHSLRRTGPKDPHGSQTPRVTIGDVAVAAGVAKGTVSRALNGYPDISAATRLRVQQAAKRMGYLPMAQAQAIRTGRARAMGLVLQMDAPDSHRPFLADFLSGISESASAEGWTLTVATATTEAETLTTLQRLAGERKADGFILPRTKLRDPRIETLRAANIPFVLFGRTEDPTGCAWFDILGEDAMAEAVHRLHALGHRRIGYIGGGIGYTYSGLRLQGYREAMAGFGLAPLEASDAVTVEAGAAAARRLLRHHKPPTALICATDMAALGAYRTTAALGLRIGHDVSVIAYDGIPQGAWADPPLSTFEVDSRAAGARLAALLVRRVRGTPPEELRETAHARLAIRGSDAAPRLSPEALARIVAKADGPTRPKSPNQEPNLREVTP